MGQFQLWDCSVLLSEHILLLNWLISEVWAAVSTNCCLCTSNALIPKNISRKAEKNENPLKRPSSLWIGIYNSFSASSQVSAALLGLSKSMYTNIIATVTTVTATPRHTGLTSWNHWTITAGKDLLDHCVQLLPKRPNPPLFGHKHWFLSFKPCSLGLKTHLKGPEHYFEGPKSDLEGPKPHL